MTGQPMRATVAKASITYRPRLLSVSEAAVYLGLSPTTLRGLPIPRRMHNSRRLYDIRDLDAYADDLPYEGSIGNEVSECDQGFGL